jgi:hypothetical protein
MRIALRHVACRGAHRSHGRASRASLQVMAGAFILLTMAGCAQNGMGPGMGQPMATSAVSPPPPPQSAPPQGFVYPARGQTAQQQEFDRGQCYSWVGGPAERIRSRKSAAAHGPASHAGGSPGWAAPGCLRRRGPRCGRRRHRGRRRQGGRHRGRGRRSLRAHAAGGEGRAGSAATGELRVAAAEHPRSGAGTYNRAFGVCMTGRGYSVS